MIDFLFNVMNISFNLIEEPSDTGEYEQHTHRYLKVKQTNNLNTSIRE